MIYKLKFLFESFEGFVKNLYNSFLSILKILFLTKFNVSFPLIDNKECVVLGNGPSLNEVITNNREFFSDKSLISVNGFPFSDEYANLKPEHLVWLDPQFYLFPNTEVLQEKRPDLIKLISDVIEKTSWPLNLFLPVRARHVYYLTEIVEKNNHVKIYYFNYTVLEGFNSLIFGLFKKNLGMPQFYNVLGASLFLGINLGYKKIWLTGADHSWFKNIYVSEENYLCLEDNHFYDHGKMAPRYIKDTFSGKKLRIGSFFLNLYKTFNSYYILFQYSEYMNCKIYNSSDLSYIDAFERKKI